LHTLIPCLIAAEDGATIRRAAGNEGYGIAMGSALLHWPASSW
jgi:hypothetical protein